MSYIPIELSGSPREIGRQRGRVFRELLVAIAEATQNGRSSTKLLEISSHLEKVLQQRYPELIEELQGISETSGVSYEDMLLLNAWWEDGGARIAGCSNVSLTYSNVGPILGSTLDVDGSLGRVMTIVRSKHGFAFADAGSRADMLGVARAINERGLCVGSSSVISNVTGLGFPLYIFCRIALQYCSTVDEVVDLLQSLKPGLANGHRIVFLDEQGSTVAIDVSPVKQVVIKDELGGIAVTNIFTAEEVKKFYTGDEEWTTDSLARYERIMNFIRTTNREDAVKEVMSLLRSHGAGGLCQHGKPELLKGTTATIILPRKREMYVSQPPGPYCESTFVRYRIF